MADNFILYLVARLLLTLATVGYGFITIIADFNRTHATNPAWTPHARFHVVWQILSYCGFGLLALALIWWPGPHALERLYLACAFAAVVYGAFFVTLFAMPLYGGRAYDDNGYRPFTLTIGRRPRLMDVNVSAFSVFITVLVVAIVLVTRLPAVG